MTFDECVKKDWRLPPSMEGTFLYCDRRNATYVVPNRSGTEVSLAGVDWLGSILAFSNEAYGNASELTEVWQPYANWRRLG